MANGTTVTFVVAKGGGSITNGTPTTAGGIATLGSWTLGAQSGTNSLSVSSGTAAAITIRAQGVLPPYIASFSTSENPAFAGDAVMFSFNATDAAMLPLTYSIAFGDGTPAASGSFTQGTSVSVSHPFAASTSGYTVTLTVNDGFTPVSQTLVQLVPMPASGSQGVPNISVNKPPIVNQVDNVSVAVTASSGGVLQMGINVGSLGSAPLSIATFFHDNSNPDPVKGTPGLTPVHQFLVEGIYVVETIVTNTATNSVVGHTRKSVIIDAAETDGHTTATGPASSNTITTKSIREIHLRRLQDGHGHIQRLDHAAAWAQSIEDTSGLDRDRKQRWICDRPSQRVRYNQQGGDDIDRAESSDSH